MVKHSALLHSPSERVIAITYGKCISQVLEYEYHQFVCRILKIYLNELLIFYLQESTTDSGNDGEHDDANHYSVCTLTSHFVLEDIDTEATIDSEL